MRRTDHRASEVQRILSHLVPADRAFLEQLLFAPSENRSRRLGERDDAVRELGALLFFPSGRALAEEIARRLRRYAASGWRLERSCLPPADPERALLHRILTLNAGASIGKDQCRRILAGLAQQQPLK